ncbi:hypothetical protein BHE90_014811 [Fusarium euwallaceae]|uniref:Uncharacterized protein n=1 Tax=Fusarium euwallaceae TaxID=1147111 RepID=A0A430L4W5_9HYPO|nr:hypothetical protein BHE90_014811 [Fusarium euwallaceae]
MPSGPPRNPLLIAGQTWPPGSRDGSRPDCSNCSVDLAIITASDNSRHDHVKSKSGNNHGHNGSNGAHQSQRPQWLTLPRPSEASVLECWSAAMQLPGGHCGGALARLASRESFHAGFYQFSVIQWASPLSTLAVCAVSFLAASPT